MAFSLKDSLGFKPSNSNIILSWSKSGFGVVNNFSPEKIKEALNIINGKYETEASGGITLENIETYAATGVDYISSGAIIHQAKSLDLSLKAEITQ